MLPLSAPCGDHGLRDIRFRRRKASGASHRKGYRALQGQMGIPWRLHQDGRDGRGRGAERTEGGDGNGECLHTAVPHLQQSLARPARKGHHHCLLCPGEDTGGEGWRRCCLGTLVPAGRDSRPGLRPRPHAQDGHTEAAPGDTLPPHRLRTAAREVHTERTPVALRSHSGHHFRPAQFCQEDAASGNSQRTGRNRLAHTQEGGKTVQLQCRQVRGT